MLFGVSANTAGSLCSPVVASSDPRQRIEVDFLLLFVTYIGVDSGWVQNSTLGSEDALAVVSQIAVRVDVAIESNGPHA